MKNSIKKQLVKKILLLTFLWVILIFLFQIVISFILKELKIDIVLSNKYLYVAKIAIYYIDIIRIGSVILSLVPYVVILIYIVNQTVVTPLNSMINELEELDYNILHKRLNIYTQYEFTQLKDSFNDLFCRLERIDDQKKLLILGMAHDLKTPITIIRGYSQALQDGIITNELQKIEYLKSINRKSIQLEELINMLFDYAKLATEEVKLNFKSIDLSEVLRKNLGIYYTDFEEKGIKFTFDIPEESVWINADSNQLSRVFANIYSNALKHNHLGDTVNTRLDIKGGINIYIEDTGDILDDDIKCHIFEPFVTGDNSRKYGSGTGLGLSIAYKIIELHSGELKVETNKDSLFSKKFVIKLKA